MILLWCFCAEVSKRLPPLQLLSSTMRFVCCFWFCFASTAWFQKNHCQPWICLLGEFFWGFYQWGCHPPCFVSPWWVFTHLWNAKSPGPKPKKGLCCLPHGVWKMMLWRMLGRLNRKKTMVSSAGKNLVLGSLCKKMAPMCWFQPELNTQGNGAMIHTCFRAALSIFINTHVVPWGHLNYLFWIILGGSNISKYCW